MRQNQLVEIFNYLVRVALQLKSLYLLSIDKNVRIDTRFYIKNKAEGVGVRKPEC